MRNGFESFEIFSILGTDRVGMGLWVVDSYRFIYIYIYIYIYII